MAFFVSSNACWHPSFQSHVVFFFNRLLISCSLVASSGMYLAKYCTDPTNDFTYFSVLGVLIFITAATLSSLGEMLFASIENPHQVAIFSNSFDFLKDALYPCLSSRPKTPSSSSLCFSIELPVTMITLWPVLCSSAFCQLSLGKFPAMHIGIWHIGQAMKSAIKHVVLGCLFPRKWRSEVPGSFVI